MTQDAAKEPMGTAESLADEAIPQAVQTHARRIDCGGASAAAAPREAQPSRRGPRPGAAPPTPSGVRRAPRR